MNNINLKGTEFEKPKAYIEEYTAGYNHAASEKENKIIFIQKHFPEKTRVEVEQIVDGLYDGCSTYMKNLGEALKDKKFSIKETFSEKLTELSIDEQYSYASNLLLVVRAIDNNVILENSDEAQLNMKQKIDELLDKKVETTPGTVSQEDLEDILTELDEAINNTAFGFYGCEEMIKFIENNTEGDTISFIQNYWENEELKVTTSMGVYIAYLRDEIPEMEGEISPNEMAVLVSAGIDKDAVIKRASAGEIGWNIAMGILTVIGVTALYVLVSLAYAVAGATLFYFATFGCAYAAVIGAVLGWIVADDVLDLDSAYDKVITFVEVTKEKVLEGYRKTRDYVKNTVVPKVKEGAEKTWNFINDKLIAGVIRAYHAFRNAPDVVV